MGVRKNWADRTTTFTCDQCGDTFEADGLDFYDALDEYKEHGGAARLEAGEWLHFCGCCE